MPLVAGTRLGPYEIYSLIGAGGMGEVYKARDTRLGRDVAIKVLPTAAAADGERRTRFEREARAVAALNHPNIVTIHDVEEVSGVPFFAMEYVEGKTLAQVIPARGLPLAELLCLAIPLTDAVGAAHQRGILHRDIKPANIMITAEGRVKVLDFGLAKLKEAAVMPAEAGARATTDATGEERILGTVVYMSPEQAEGKAIDQRADVFSLGIVLYEMATGQRPFKGDTSVSVISAIIKDTPGSVTDLRPDLPRDLVRIIKRALNKDPEHRYQTAKDLRNDLESLKEDLDSGEIARGTSRAVATVNLRRRLSLVAVVIVLAAAAGAGWWTFYRSWPASRSAAASLPFENMSVKRIDTEHLPSLPAVSPDGKYIAYVTAEATGQRSLQVRQVGMSAGVQVVPPTNLTFNTVAFSPDGSRLYYNLYAASGGGLATLFEVPVLGGTPHQLFDDVDRFALSRDGKRLAWIRGFPLKNASLVVANSDTTGEHTLVDLSYPNEFALTSPAWSADGRSIAAAVYGPERSVSLVLVDVARGSIHPIASRRWTSLSSMAWLGDASHLLIAAADVAASETGQLWDVNVADGSVRRITNDIATYARVSLTANARTLVTVQLDVRRTLWLASSGQLDLMTRIAATPDTVWPDLIRWTRDGRIVYTACIDQNWDVWAASADGRGVRQLTNAPAVDRIPIVSPDDRFILFGSLRSGNPRLWRMDVDGSRQAMLPLDASVNYPLVASDGRGVYFVRADQPGNPLYVLPLDGGRPRLLSAPSTGGSRAAWPGIPVGFCPYELSPDGVFVLGWYYDDTVTPPTTRTAVVPVGGGNARVFARAGHRWAADGRALTFPKVADGAWNIWRQPLDGGAATRLTNFAPGDPITDHAWSRDGKLLAIVRTATSRHLVMMRDESQ